MDGMGRFITRTEMPHSHATLYGGMGNFGKATCASCKSTVFNEWFDEYGYDVYSERYSDDWTAALTQDDVWSCGMDFLMGPTRSRERSPTSTRWRQPCALACSPMCVL